jgi:hypothetical protein
MASVIFLYPFDLKKEKNQNQLDEATIPKLRPNEKTLKFHPTPV